MKLRRIKVRRDLKIPIRELSEKGFRQIFDRIDQLNIKKGVDRMGVDKFIEQCAYLAAGSGVISGTGGVLTMIIGVPIDFVNLITQQFRVSMAILYAEKGSYHVDFEDFMGFIATSLKVEAGVTVTKAMLEGVAEKLLMLLGTRTAERLVPIVGGMIGGAANYLFIKRMAESVKKIMNAEDAVIVID
ncbi:MAG TPA: hypothetical protein VHA56_12430 [Mucilaginibacter sp.]|nr:hypothetical protein [Mucilaginibacter sp.]